MEARIDKLEKAILSALEKTKQPTPAERNQVQVQADQESAYPYYGPPPEMEYPTQVNAAGSWNANDSWNPGKQRDALWRDHPNFRNPEGPQQWNNRSQGGNPNWSGGNHPNWSNRNQQENPANSYVPLHQRGFPGGNANHPQGNQGGQGPNAHYNHNQGSGGNFHPHQGPGYNSYHQHQGNFPHNQSSGFNQQGSGPYPPYPRQQNRPTDDLVGDLLNSQQHLQSNMQANNDVVHKLQDAHQEQKAAMDVLAKQLSQIATSINEMRGNDGQIPATVKMPDKANISQITLRSGKAYQGPSQLIDGGTVEAEKRSEGRLVQDDIQPGESRNPLPLMADPFFLEQEPEEKESEEDARKKDRKTSGETLVAARSSRQSLILAEGRQGRKKRTLLTSWRFLAKSDGKIVIGENVSAVIQKEKLPSKRNDPGMFTLPITLGGVRIEHAMCDLGASINVLPLSVYQRLIGARMVDTKVVIQLADRSCIHPEEVLENVIVQVHDFLYPADFHVIKMTEPESTGSSKVLLGRPFLRTAKTIINVFDGIIYLDYHGEKYTFSIDEAMKKPMDVENLHSVDVIAPLVQEYLEEEFLQEKFEGTGRHEEMEREVAGWCKDVQTQGLTDQEISAAILEFCQRPQAAGSSRFLQLASVKKMPEIEEPNMESMEKNPLPLEAKPEKKELKQLPPGLKYSYLGEDQTLPMIVNSKLTKGQEERLLEVLRRNQKAIGWTLLDLVGLSPDLCMHHIRLEEGAKAHRDPQRKLNPHMHEEVMKEILKLLSLGIIYSIPDSEWIYIDPEDQSKTTFTCPFRTYAYRRMPFRLCNAPGTFQRCMMSIFSDLLEECIEIFMDDFTVYEVSFETCLHHLDVVLERCQSKNLVLNYEKCHFKVTEGIVRGHVVSVKEIQVDQAKVDVIAKLPHPTNQKEIRGFLGHAGFYRRFIKDFAKIAYPLTRLLQNEVDFDFDDAYKEAFQLLEERLISAPIIRSPDWNLPFEIMPSKTTTPWRRKCYRWCTPLINSDLIYWGRGSSIGMITQGKEEEEIPDAFPEEHLYLTTMRPHLISWAHHVAQLDPTKSSQGAMKKNMEPWFAELANYLVTGELPFSTEVTRAQRMKIKSESKYYFWDDPYLWKMGTDQVIRRCIPDWEQ
ncbi:hypothetical protein AAHA92_33985 [Salvia divinorum]|uniref:Reverse transcriptase domain-containing protein n=1 Tax=Salvia divinorum TaxID=28513 RepID=A0ABD1FHH3_SALDI